MYHWSHKGTLVVWLTTGEEAEANEHRQYITHAEDVVHQVMRPQQQGRGNAKCGKIGKVIQLGT